MQFTILNLFALGGMDSLHVSGQQQQVNSKTSSRSTSPCRRGGETHHHHIHSTPQPHHNKSLSHGSQDSNKSDGVGYTTTHHRSHQRHKSPTAPADSIAMDECPILDETGPSEAEVLDPCYPSSFISNGSSEHVKPEDETDAAGNTRITATIEHLANKIIRVKDLIRTEQKLRDDNVNEYLKLAANADKHQVQRIKAVFEKKNQKSAHNISQLQKKLDTYQKRVHDLETHGVVQSHRPPREVLRDMGQGLKNVGGNIRDGITGFSGSVMSKPREFAHLIKNKFGSADNISQLSRPGTTGSEGSGTNGGAGSDQGEKVHHGSATLPATLHAATSNVSMGGQQPQKFPSEEGSECSSVTSESMDRYRGRSQEGTSTHEVQYNSMFKQLQTTQEELQILRKKFDGAITLRQDVQFLSSALQEERFKTERLEEQINDLTELHQNEVENLKQAMADMEEKVQYQSEERLRDIHEILEHCQTKIQKMEHQALQQQQYVTLEGLDNSNARAFAVKLINVLLTVLQVILLLVATCAGIIMPFLRTRVRILTTLGIVLLGIFVLRQWPEVQDIGSHVMKRLKDMLDPVK
ncbi:PREDICTED: transmembrane and coiled-coil domains protein 2 isoform X2 [Nicrophorus vespilloides]|uniref:Transmembrane and coiled-coil domains protein 2 isoform X2 n=1 Tax=Nicrophorus vespilloides TaxID=110193 RepID=A0ABM1MP43_NICVS|nr:PREDICTED: transmembrane and coiled-coil domains protein 2 isoform X2 [Nicrophorus vespilloides]